MAEREREWEWEWKMKERDREGEGKGRRGRGEGRRGKGGRGGEGEGEGGGGKREEERGMEEEGRKGIVERGQGALFPPPPFPLGLRSDSSGLRWTPVDSLDPAIQTTLPLKFHKLDWTGLDWTGLPVQSSWNEH